MQIYPQESIATFLSSRETNVGLYPSEDHSSLVRLLGKEKLSVERECNTPLFSLCYSCMKTNMAKILLNGCLLHRFLVGYFQRHPKEVILKTLILNMNFGYPKLRLL